MTGSVVAATTQRQTAFAHYWQDTLRLTDSQRDVFLAAVRGAPLVLPVDVSGRYGLQSMADVLVSSPDAPPSPSCNVGLSDAAVRQYTVIERNLFGFEGDDGRQLGATCARPHYGVLDVFHLRAPFADSDPRIGSLPGQAIVLQADVKSRVLLHAGELLLTGGGLSPPSTTRASFGSFAHLDSVLLDWLRLMPNVTVAREAVLGVISGTPIDLPGVPLLEAAVFGRLPFSVVDYTMARIAVHGSDGPLLFGSELGSAWRRWALQSETSSIRWVLTAFDGALALAFRRRLT
jgi:hypothetical protein